MAMEDACQPGMVLTSGDNILPLDHVIHYESCHPRRSSDIVLQESRLPRRMYGVFRQVSDCDGMEAKKPNTALYKRYRGAHPIRDQSRSTRAMRIRSCGSYGILLGKRQSSRFPRLEPDPPAFVGTMPSFSSISLIFRYACLTRPLYFPVLHRYTTEDYSWLTYFEV